MRDFIIDLKKELYKSINLCGLNSFKTIEISQRLDEKIVLEMKDRLYKIKK